MSTFPDPPLDPPDSERPLTTPARLARARQHPDAEPDDFHDEPDRAQR